ncbi:MAG: hypothetical protein C5B51_22700 [Terriglobia bacterium]|nr:MAG: hypothetical protein C5B51_22700 [Terriglobia bacterium]
MILRRILQVVNQAWFSYLTIFLLQLKMIWGIWWYRDLSNIDTAYYFVAAYEWFAHRAVYILWSPLYTAFYGTFLHVWRDAYQATTAHRVAIVLGLCLLVLAIMRRLLPPGIAWLMAAWWVILPIDFDSIFEVHLFGLLPLVAALLVLLWKPGAWGRGWALAILLASTVLIRNEALIVLLLFGACCLIWEIQCHRRKAGPGPYLWLQYGLPLAMACLTIAFFYTRALETNLAADLHEKEVSNFCISYAFGYHQRHPEWQGSFGAGCHDLLVTVYGNPRVTFVEAARLNAPAVAQHLLWNLRLAADGIQVLLFNAMTGSITPDYDFAVPVPAKSRAALAASLLGVLLLVTASVRFWRDRGYWWATLIKPRFWAWQAMGCITITSGIILLIERPRPAYLFALGLVLRVLIGVSVLIIAREWPKLDRLDAALPALMILLILFVPSYYRPGGRRLLTYYHLLRPFEARIETTPTILLTQGNGPELCNYLAKPRTDNFCQPLEFVDLRNEVQLGQSWQQVLDRYGVTLFLADASVMADPAARQFVMHAASYGWRSVTKPEGIVLERIPAPSLPKKQSGTGIQ